jgi:hypothetical protein
MSKPKIPISYARVAAAYPDKKRYPAPAGNLLDEIGAEVRLAVRDSDNTCAVRLSYAFNHGGLPIKKIGAGIRWLNAAPRIEPGTETWVKPRILHDAYIIRVNDFKAYLTARFGGPVPIWDGYHPEQWKVPFTGSTQGVICFEWKGPPKVFGASGHMDLFRVVLTNDSSPQFVPACVEHCYWQEGPMYASFWEMSP